MIFVKNRPSKSERQSVTHDPLVAYRTTNQSTLFNSFISELYDGFYHLRVSHIPLNIGKISGFYQILICIGPIKAVFSNFASQFTPDAILTIKMYSLVSKTHREINLTKNAITASRSLRESLLHNFPCFRHADKSQIPRIGSKKEIQPRIDVRMENTIVCEITLWTRFHGFYEPTSSL